MHRDMRYWAMACWMGAMAHQVCVVLSTAERERLAAIVADRNRLAKTRAVARLRVAHRNARKEENDA